MKLSMVSQGARPTPGDRNQTSPVKSYLASNIAPHANTTRWTYTVPASRKCLVVGGMTEMLRETVATAVGEYATQINFTPSGGVLAILYELVSLNNTVAYYIQQNVPAGKVLLAGDTWSGSTVDNSTGGTVRYATTADLNEYDA